LIGAVRAEIKENVDSLAKRPIYAVLTVRLAVRRIGEMRYFR
jgi:hypothetical protein